LVGATFAQRGGRRSQRPRGGRDGTGYAAPAADSSYAAPDAQPAYGGDQDVYQVRQDYLFLKGFDNILNKFSCRELHPHQLDLMITLPC